MTKYLSSEDWAAERGQKWCRKLEGMEATLRPLDAPIIEALLVSKPCRIADVGCGGGGTTIEIHRASAEGSTVHGYDINPDLIAAARNRIPEGDNTIAFQIADMAATLPLAKPYDRLTSRFGILFFDDELGAFSNLLRWLSPGGRLAFAVWGPAAENPWMASVRQVVSEIIDIPAPDPDDPGPFRYADIDKFNTLLTSAGFSDLDLVRWRGKLQMGGGLSATEAAHFALDAISSFSEMLAEAGQGAIDKAHGKLTELYSHHEQDGAVAMDACMHIVTGTRVRRAGRSNNISVH